MMATVAAQATAHQQRVRVRLSGRAREEYEILIGEDTLRCNLGEVARRVSSSHTHRAVIISNRKVFELYGAQAQHSLHKADFKVAHWLMNDGERYKSLQTFESALQFFADAKLERSDIVVALGGGVVGDLAGFAASVYLRGLPYLQAPTTLLAQIDSSVGGKTAVNSSAGKNTIGTFHHPRAVIIDTSSLRTLPPRELTAGWCEAIKQGAIGGRKLFDATCAFLQDEATQNALRGEAASNTSAQSRSTRLNKLIAAQVAFKAQIVRGDEREDAARTDARSRRILNFGHTVAHALELVTRYRQFRHGEAVGYGMLVAGELSAKLGLLDVVELECLRAAVRLAGRLPRADNLDEALIINAISRDKKSVGGSVKWVLLEKLGQPIIVDGREIPAQTLRASLRQGLKQITLKERVA